MGIGTADAKGANTCPQKPAVIIPRLKLFIKVKGTVFKVYPGIGGFKMYCGRYLFVFDCQYSFDNPGDPGRGVQVTDIGFKGSQSTVMLFIGVTIIKFDGESHIPLILGTCVASIMAVRLGLKWKEIEKSLVHGITLGLQACLILMVVGTLIGLWILGGVVPAMIYYGLKLVVPSIFLVTTCVICSLVSLSTGSSWSTAGTVGLALIGIGNTLGIPAHMVAGAIISGAYFGDKMSPLSDTTNLAPATAGTDLFTHIRHMVYTTGPSLFIALILYTIIGLKYGNLEAKSSDVELMLNTIQSNFSINLWLLIPPCLVILMVVLKIPALPALIGGSMLGGLAALIFQGNSLADVINTAHSGFVSETGIAKVDDLLSRGGLMSMMSTVALIMCALSFGGVMEKSGMLASIANAVL